MLVTRQSCGQKDGRTDRQEMQAVAGNAATNAETGQGEDRFIQGGKGKEGAVSSISSLLFHDELRRDDRRMHGGGSRSIWERVEKLFRAFRLLPASWLVGLVG